jgi:serine/threonine protein kinase
MFDPGTRLENRFEVRNVLGSGGFGIVYLAHDLHHDRACAIKTPRESLLTDPRRRERFLQEARIWVELDAHPYIVEAYQVGHSNGQPYIAIEYIAPNGDGMNEVGNYLRSGPIGLPLALSWTVQFCEGLGYALEQRIRSHRDIKPANLLVGQRRELKITDFGLAAQASSASTLGFSGDGLGPSVPTMLGNFFGQTGRGIGFGTPTHMPPEQFDDAASCDVRADIYSFGFVLYQIATGGHLPFHLDYPKQARGAEWMQYWGGMQHAHNTRPVPPTKTPLDPIIQRCTQKNPSDRFQSLGEMKEAALAVAGQYGITVASASTDRTGRPSRLFSKGLSLQNLREYEQALGCYEKVLESNPQAPTVLNNMASCYAALGQYEDALATFGRTLALDDSVSDVWANRARCFRLAGQYDEAVVDLGEAIRLDPSRAAYWSQLGNVYLDLDEPRKALGYLQRASKMDPDQVLYRCPLGRAWLRLGEPRRAIECLDAATQQRAAMPEAWALLGTALAQVGDFSRAEQALDYARKQRPGSASYLNNLACVALLEGKRDYGLQLLKKAQDECAKAVLPALNAIVFGDERAHGVSAADVDGRYRRYLARAEVAQALRSGMAADADAAQALSESRSAADSVLLGYLLLRDGDAERALRANEAAVSASGDEATTHVATYNAGVCYAALGRFEEALSSTQRVSPAYTGTAACALLYALASRALGDHRGYTQAYRDYAEAVRAGDHAISIVIPASGASPNDTFVTSHEDTQMPALRRSGLEGLAPILLTPHAFWYL